MRLFILARVGLGVLDEAIPMPNEGCRMKKGNITVPMP
jgi:hypothetical protein